MVNLIVWSTHICIQEAVTYWSCYNMLLLLTEGIHFIQFTYLSVNEKNKEMSI